MLVWVLLYGFHNHSVLRMERKERIVSERLCEARAVFPCPTAGKKPLKGNSKTNGPIPSHLSLERCQQPQLQEVRPISGDLDEGGVGGAETKTAQLTLGGPDPSTGQG